jgi:tungstate transport system ATP-binding protein
VSADCVYRLRGVRQDHTRDVVLDLAELDIEAGSVLALLGPTGAGKSTLLRLLAGVEQPARGSVTYRGRALMDLPLGERRRITLVFQRPLLLDASVRANVGYGLSLRGEAARGLVDAMLERLGLAALADRSARTLSGGETQLIALARALAIRPDVLLLDEPTSNLDPAHVTLVERVIAEERAARAMTIVWATHNLFQARRCATEIALLLDGRLIERGETRRFFDDARDPRTRAFVRGEMVY